MFDQPWGDWGCLDLDLLRSSHGLENLSTELLEFDGLFGVATGVQVGPMESLWQGRSWAEGIGHTSERDVLGAFLQISTLIRHQLTP